MKLKWDDLREILKSGTERIHSSTTFTPAAVDEAALLAVLLGELGLLGHHHH